MDHPEGASETGNVRLGIDRRVRVEFDGSKISSDDGLVFFRELDEVLGLHDIAGEFLRGKHAINWTRLSCKGKAQNEVRLQLHALAYNLVLFLKGTDLPEKMADWSLTSLQARLIKIGARVVRHARAITFQLAKVAFSGDLFNRILTATSDCVRRRFPYDRSNEKA